MNLDAVAPGSATDYNQSATEWNPEYDLVEDMLMSDPRSDEKFLYDELLMLLDDGM